MTPYATPMSQQSESSQQRTTKMNPQTQTSVASTVLLVSLTYVPLFLSFLSLYYAELFAARPVQHFLVGLAPWWMAYISARWYVRLAEQSSPLYHPLGCLAQCCIWVFHWIISLYHAYFATKYTFWTYLITVFCAGVVVITEGMFYGLVTMDVSDTAYLGVYEKIRNIYGRSLVILVKLWYLVDVGIPQQQDRNRVRRPMQPRSMTL